eukprot:gene13802-18512_t
MENLKTFIGSLGSYILLIPFAVVIWFDSSQFVLLAWLMFQLFVIIKVRNFYMKYSYLLSSKFDIILIFIVIILEVIFSGSLSLDFISENAKSVVYVQHKFIPPYICEGIVWLAENHVRQINDGKWRTDRHKYYPTTDVSAYSINQQMTFYPSDNLNHPLFAENIKNNNGINLDFVTWLNATIQTQIFPLLCQIYKINNIKLLSMQDLFIVKYSTPTPDDINAQRSLRIHQDSSRLSFNIALSNLNDNNKFDGYYGGGTHFILSNETIQIEKGSLLLHPSRLYHGGESITSGKRYILVGFVKVNIWSWETIWRRFGSLSRCLEKSSSLNKDFHHIN